MNFGSVYINAEGRENKFYNVCWVKAVILEILSHFDQHCSINYYCISSNLERFNSQKFVK